MPPSRSGAKAGKAAKTSQNAQTTPAPAPAVSAGTVRPSGRAPDELRALTLTKDYLRFAEGSCLVQLGATRVLCAASLEDKAPPFMRGTGRGWVTAEYSMLPRSTMVRTQRDVWRGKAGGRTHEIQRLVGRSLRAVVDLGALGERTIVIDCDVIEADGSTRVAAITGGFVALVGAIQHLKAAKVVTQTVLRDHVAGVSAGIVGGVPVLDLDYAEDSTAGVDMNVVMTGAGALVEVQGTADREPFSSAELGALLDLGRRGIAELVAAQRQVLALDALP
jgi:ribonuclease PH